MSKQNYPVVAALLILAGLAGLNVLAFQNFWYWRIWWFDILMHGLGGVAIALLAVYGWRRFIEPAGQSSLVAHISTGWAAIIVISLAWELFEFTVDQSARLHLVAKDILTLQAGVLDTLGDIISALAGGIIGGLIIHKLNLWQPKNQD